MNLRLLPGLLLGLVLTGVGLVCGWYGAAHARAGEAGPAPAEPDEPAGGPVLAPETLKNLGVEAAPVRLESFRLTRPVAAVVAALPTSRQTVYAPVAGRVRSVEAVLGAVVEKGQALVTLLRDPLPRATLALTEDVLKPVREGFHEAVAKLHRARVSVEVLNKEQDRLRAFAQTEEGLPLLPKKDLIQLQYDLMQAEREVQLAEDELERHGLSSGQIREIEKGRMPAIDVGIWLSTLQQSGLWTGPAQEVYAALPAAAKASPWTVATIAELVAGDLVPPGLVAWLEGDEAVSRRFLEIGGLLQRGHGLAEIRHLHALGALEEVVAVRAPDHAPDWDVSSLAVRPGKHVAAGEALLELEDLRRLYLQGEPTESEIRIAVSAMQAGAELAASPLVPGAAPELAALSIRQIVPLAAGSRASLFLPLANRPQATRQDPAGPPFRSWELRPGQRYELRIPTQELARVYVLPATAVVDDGPDKVVFLRSGESFRKIQVEVLHHDQRVAVLPASSRIFPGNPIVTRGAFALKLAFAAAGGGESGHDHVH